MLLKDVHNDSVSKSARLVLCVLSSLVTSAEKKYEALPGTAGSQALQSFTQRLTLMCEMQQKSS